MKKRGGRLWRPGEIGNEGGSMRRIGYALRIAPVILAFLMLAAYFLRASQPGRTTALLRHRRGYSCPVSGLREDVNPPSIKGQPRLAGLLPPSIFIL